MSAIAVLGALDGAAIAGPIARSAALTSAPYLHRVLVDGSGTQVVVRLVASREISGTLKAAGQPMRIFLDLEGVVPGGQRLVAVSRGAVRQVRVALNRADPPVTRVVLDLEAATSYRLEQSGDKRELRITVDGIAARSEDASERYVSWFRSTAVSVEAVLKQTAQRRSPDAIGLEHVARLKAEWIALQQDIERMTAPRSFLTEHALLIESARLGQIAAARREDAAQGTADALAGEAGAAMLLARARAAVAATITATR